MTCRPAVLPRAASALLCALALAAPAGAAADAPRAAAELIERLLPSPLLLVGEQHDALEHQALQRALVQGLAEQKQLAAVVMEMLERGQQTTGLAPDADEPLVRRTLQWTDEQAAGWPWATYGPVVMAAVRAGVPVLGGNVPRAEMRTAMGQATLDQLLPAPALAEQQENIRQGHCGLLPESQIAPMTRIQIARDKSMAEVAMGALQAGRTVLLVAGNGHVRRDLGVPRYLPASLGHRVLMAQAALPDGTPAARDSEQADMVWPTPARPAVDHCAELKKQMGR